MHTPSHTPSGVKVFESKSGLGEAEEKTNNRDFQTQVNVCFSERCTVDVILSVDL